MIRESEWRSARAKHLRVTDAPDDLVIGHPEAEEQQHNMSIDRPASAVFIRSVNTRSPS